jgi:hypothetical protein
MEQRQPGELTGSMKIPARPKFKKSGVIYVIAGGFQWTKTA